MHQTIHKGAVAPYALQIIFESEDPTFDLTSATAATFKVMRDAQREDVDTESWPATLSGAQRIGNHSEVLVEHVYQAGDLPRTGVLQVYAEFVTPSGPMESAPFKVLVTSKFGE